MTEFELIAEVTRDLPRTANDLALGVGDDCAILNGPEGKDWLITADALNEGVHFLRAGTDLVLLGRKALSVNISDIAAMGGVPRFFLVTIGIPPDMTPEQTLPLMQGMKAVAAEQGVLLIGGDTTASATGLTLSITVMGEVRSGSAILRRGARAGDAILVTGTLGSSAAGLTALLQGNRDTTLLPFRVRHDDPTPRTRAGQWLHASCAVTAMIDVSDGLVADLTHIAEASHVGFTLQWSQIPLEAGLVDAARILNTSVQSWALSGGEDYELLMTVAPERVAGLLADWDEARFGCHLTRIGTVEASPSVCTILDASGLPIELAIRGFDHFANRLSLR